MIRARDARKIYRLYTKPSYRFLDMFGLLRERPGLYTEHAALDGVSLEVGRGERVAIIGRNGAGKSTLLKLITQVIEPTSGVIEVHGRMHALLQIGTGFHPDFTGRENVRAYLAQLGVSGLKADTTCDEIVDFAELEEYIDQPMKTYSTGMAVRLMFSASTAITPDLLVLDEILGVGDAYFSHKSYQRIRDLCQRLGTTVLLVTHDVYSAVQLCERVIWIDAGRVLLDGDGPTVVKAYEDSIRQQEERRLRLRKQRQIAQSARRDEPKAPVGRALLEIRAADGRPGPSPVYFSAVKLLIDNEVVASWPLGGDAFADEQRSHLQQEGSAWGEEGAWEGRPARPMLNFGSTFHKVAGVFAVDRLIDDVDPSRIGCALDFWTDEPCELAFRLFVGGREMDFGSLTSARGVWTAHVARSTSSAAPPPSGVNTSGVHGTGTIVVTDAHFVNPDGTEAYMLAHGKPATLQIAYEIRDPALRESAQVVVALHRDGVQDVCRFITRDLRFDGVSNARGVIRLSIPSLTLTDGRYEVTIMIAKEGYYDTAQTLFYTINPSVYCCISRMFEISVSGSGLIGSGTMQIGAGAWTLEY